MKDNQQAVQLQQPTTIGHYLAVRLAQAGVKHHFVVPGDYNLGLLDKLQYNNYLEEVNCANELNCAFAAEGYARANGIAACVVTYSVGAFTAFDGIGGAYAEDLPVILISGSPNTNDIGSSHLLHHTLGTHDFSYQYEMAKKITCAAVSIQRPTEAPRLIDYAIKMALLKKKPVYIEVPTNVASQPCAAPGPASLITEPETSNQESLQMAVDISAKIVNGKQKPVLLAGPKLRSFKAESAFLELANSLNCSVAVMPNAKSFFPESHPNYAGIYWGQASTLGAESIINWSDCIICAGTTFTDYSSNGWTSLPPKANVLHVDVDRVTVSDAEFGGVLLKDFLHELAKKVKANNASVVEYKRIRPESLEIPMENPKAALNRKEIIRQVQNLVNPETTLFVDTGDSWFGGMRITLPEKARFEIEMQWGHIGWSVPSAFGYAVGAPKRNVVVFVGDGSFQETVQEVSQMVRLNLPIIMFLINNRGYTIEVEIHDGPYNRIKNWDYAAIVEAFNAGEGHAKGFRVGNGHELAEAIRQAKENSQGPTLIECNIDQDDCSKELINWGHNVGAANGKPPAKE